MRILRIAIGSTLGAILATIISWGGLYLYGTIVLHGNGSLFDTNPTAANIFFGIWLFFVVAASIVGGYVGHAFFAKKIK